MLYLLYLYYVYGIFKFTYKAFKIEQRKLQRQILGNISFCLNFKLGQMIRNEAFQEDELRELADLTTNVCHLAYLLIYFFLAKFINIIFVLQLLVKSIMVYGNSNSHI